MRVVFLLILIALCVSAQSYAQPQEETGQLELKISINDLRSSKGQVAIQLLDLNDKVIREKFVLVTENRVKVEFLNLYPSKYSIRYFHDENGNEEMDTNMFGIPKEGYGFSNNAHGFMGPPEKEKRLFNLIEDASIQLIIKYM